MTNNPESIIDEYLAIVREKLPESIADDVITELETYMLETARDQGEDGQITFESAKKVVAQFGAPGEVADEYRFSMFPESIPEEDIPKEIAQEPIASEQQVSKEEPIIRKAGVDPTVTHSSFFYKSVFLSIMWATIVTAATTLIGPIWATGWHLIIIVGEVLIVVGILFVRFLDLKSKNVILWKRSYPDWSKLQIFVTLPENGLPSYGKKRIFFDIIVSIIGIISCTSMIFFGNHPWFIIFIGIPATVLLVLRILVSIRKLSDERNPCEMARLDFGINISLLTILDSSFFWLFSYQYWGYSQFIGGVVLLMVTFNVLGGAVLLFEVLMEAENLWWTTEKQLSEDQKSRKAAVRKDILRNVGTMLVKIIGWIVIVDSVIVYSSLIFAPEEMSNLYWSRLTGLIGSIILGASLVIVYCLIRYIRVRNFNSITFIGRRTRLEAFIDSIVSIFLIFAISIIAIGTLSTSIPGYSILHFYPNVFHFSINLGGVVVGMEFLLLLLVIIAFSLRVQGNILEFKSERKIDAANRIQKSGKMMLITVSFIAGGEFVHYLSIVGSWYFIIMTPFYFFFMTIVIFLAFQVVSSGMKVRELKEIELKPQNKDKGELRSESNNYTKIVN